jgi:serine/threonine-protein kinase RsbW
MHSDHTADGGSPRIWNRIVYPSAAIVPVAKAEFRKSLAGGGLSGVEDDALLILSELLTSAVLHSASWVAMSAEVGKDCRHLVIQVCDWQQASAETDDTGLPDSGLAGHRLFLVTAVSAQWGVREQDGGRAVWAAIQVPGAGDPGKQCEGSRWPL